jgi:replication factor A1
LQSFPNVDVIGKITAISNAAVARNTSGDLMMRRMITFKITSTVPKKIYAFANSYKYFDI